MGGGALENVTLANLESRFTKPGTGDVGVVPSYIPDSDSNQSTRRSHTNNFYATMGTGRNEELNREHTLVSGFVNRIEK